MRRLLLSLPLVLVACFAVQAQPGPGPVNQSAARFRRLASEPATCVAGDVYHNLTTHKDRQCLTANTWSDFGTGSASADATYITQTPNASLSNEQALSLLATGIPKVTTGTGAVSISNVTDDVQTKASIVPNTVPSAGQLLAGNAGGTAYAPVSLSQDCTITSLGVVTCLKTNNVSFGALATVTPGTGVATALGVATGSIGAFTLNNLAQDNAFVGNTSGIASAKSIGSCSAGSSALTYNTTTHAFGCNSISGITNSAGANVVPISDGTNLTGGTVGANRITAASGAITIDSGVGSTTIGDVNGAGNATKITISDAATNSILFNPGAGYVAFNGAPVPDIAGSQSNGDGSRPWASLYIGDAATSNMQISTVTSAAVVAAPAYQAYLATNATTTSNTLANLTGMTISGLKSGRKYSFTLIIFLSDSVAAEGAKFDLAGGSATATDFRAHVTLFDTALNLSTQITALNTVISSATVTGASMLEIHGSFEPSGDGTFIPRFAQVAHAVGTLTVFRGSHLIIKDAP